MNVTITYLGSSKTWPSILSVKNIAELRQLIMVGEAIFAEDDLPPEWVNIRSEITPDGSQMALTFPSNTYVVTVS